MFWNLEIVKDGILYYAPMMFVRRKSTTIKIGKQSKYCFQIFVCLDNLSRDGYFTDEIVKSGEYKIQLLTKLVKPQIEIRSNIISVIVN